MSSVDAAAARPSRSRARLTRARTVLLTVIVAGGVFLTTTQTWVHATLTSGTVRSIDAAVNGSDAARSVTALALVALAGALALSIAGRIARVIIAVVIVLAGVGGAVAAFSVLGDPAAAADGKIAAQSGVTGGAIDASVTGWVIAAAVVAIVLAACGVLVLVAGRRWDSARRFETPAATAAEADAATGSPTGTAAAGAAATDAPGRDGTAAAAPEAIPADATAPTGAPTGAPTAAAPVDDIDSWDRLTRGQDPTD
ncbi:Trp biosynthesis-associated membrane protein [Tersicoccus sp. MR15.9]|uniref:Trp biosynthesis-associated membrane protein n=1 Tax=Tersicoccus mangrovi TaxID=3121635 RepID=UPI002FE60691